MKRYLSLILLLCMCFSFVGCQNKSEELKVPANFYYLKQEFSYGVEDAVIAPEIRESVHIRDNLSALLKEYLHGPKDNALTRAVPTRVSIVEVYKENRTVTLVLSPEFSRLSGIDLTLACACLSMTVMDYADADTVEIMVPDELLGDSERIKMTREDLLLLDIQTTDDTTPLE